VTDPAERTIASAKIDLAIPQLISQRASSWRSFVNVG
jgi:hypothetical protein